MTLEIIATESLGVRGMCCLVTTGERRILIDPGLALVYIRHGLLPHHNLEGSRCTLKVVQFKLALKGSSY